jgi:hypothetical protein
MTVNPLLALAIALGSALVASIAAFVYTDHRCRQRLALLCQQRPACAAQPQPEPAPLPRQLRHQGDLLIIVERVRRPRNN